MNARVIITFLCLAALCACGNEPPVSFSDSKPDTPKQIAVAAPVNRDSLRRRVRENARYLGDSLLGHRGDRLEAAVQKYQYDSCYQKAYEDAVLKRDFEGFKAFRDLDGNGRRDTVFVLPSFNYCDDGEAYCFLDSALPRLVTDSYCCHPDNLFPIGDIDEDGVEEICIFHSGCVSRYKSLIAYSLESGSWKEIGATTFDIFYMKPDKEKRVRKTGKGRFEMLDNKYGVKKWERFSF